MVDTLLGAFAFGCFLYIATIWCERIAGRDSRKEGLGSEALRVSLCSATALVGGILLAHDAPPATIFGIAILSVALGTTCFLATLGRPVPAAIPVAALAILAGEALTRGDCGPLVSALATGTPFAIAAFFGRDKGGSDWRDAVVAALGGAAFGLQLGLVACIFAGVALALVRPYLARRLTGTEPQHPVRFSSALSGTFMVALVGQLAIS